MDGINLNIVSHTTLLVESKYGAERERESEGERGSEREREREGVYER